MPRLRPFLVMLYALVMAAPALAGDATPPDLPRILFAREFPSSPEIPTAAEAYFRGGLADRHGRFLAFGRARGGRTSSTSLDAWILHFDRSGTLDWQRLYGKGFRDPDFFAVSSHPGGGFLAAGATARRGRQWPEGWLVRLGDDGAIRWQRIVTLSDHLMLKTVAATADGGAVATGDMITCPCGHGADQDTEVFLRFDARGHLLKHHAFAMPAGSYIDRLTADGGDQFVAMGHFTVKDWGKQISLGALGLDSDGRLLWRRTLLALDQPEEELHQFIPGLGYAIAHITNEQALEIQRFDPAGRPLWSARDDRIATEGQAGELSLRHGKILLRRDGAVSVALPGPFSDAAGKPTGLLVTYQAPGTPIARQKISVPAPPYYSVIEGLEPWGQGGTAVVLQSYSPGKRTKLSVQAWPAVGH